MSKYPIEPLSFAELKTVSLRKRGGKVEIAHFAKPFERSAGVNGLIDSLPHLLAATQFRELIHALRMARHNGRQIIWGLGGHVIKCGLAPVLIDLMHRGFITALAMNGSTSIHDFEIAIAGSTSEDVESVLPDGSFGAAEETGREMNLAISAGARKGIGMGEALGASLETLADPAFRHQSLLVEAYRAAIPVTVHVAVGTDTPHTHAHADGSAIGETTHRDFRLFCKIVSGLNDGGVYLNIGSAVILPEVFLKAVSVVRNLGNPLREFTTVNFDFLQHYRPRANVVQRPHAQSGGQGLSITGHHELMIPLLAAALIESEP